MVCSEGHGRRKVSFKGHDEGKQAKEMCEKSKSHEQPGQETCSWLTQLRQHDNAVNCVKRHCNEQSREAKRRKVQDKEPRQQLDAWHNEGLHNEEMGDDLLKIVAMVHNGLQSVIQS